MLADALEHLVSGIVDHPVLERLGRGAAQATRPSIGEGALRLVAAGAGKIAIPAQAAIVK